MRIKIILVIIFCFLITNHLFAGAARPLLDKGWSELVRDNDVEAMKYFNMAYEQAKDEKNTEEIALSLLNMGICSYMVSYSTGLEYCSRAMAEFKKLEESEPIKALQGRCKCLQLISTIYSRQGKYQKAIILSKEAMAGFASENDTTGYLGLIYNSLGVAYGRLNKQDSSNYYHCRALKEHLLTKNYTYLPSSYLYVANLELEVGNKMQSQLYYERAKAIADSTGNRQSKVAILLGIGKWYLTFEKDGEHAEKIFLEAKEIANGLSDKSFYLKTLNSLIELKKNQGNFQEALSYEEEVAQLKDTLNTWERQRIVKSLEIQFDVSEKERKLKIAENEKDIVTLTNYILWGAIAFILIIFTVSIFFLKRINRRDKLLLQTKEELVKTIEEKKLLQEQKMQNELEFKESQLSAITLQMLQKNNLLLELKEQLEKDKELSKEPAFSKIINQGLNHDKEWLDFNTSFERINKNFYVKLKQYYPDISPNDLKICALIKLNLSIKEMAGILNISPDSVKTARYRLRKKLQLNTEDNLTEFIQSV